MGRQSSEPVGHQVPQAAADPVTQHGIAHCLTHDETHPSGVLTRLDGHRVLVLGIPIDRQGMDNQPGAPDATSPANHRPELLATGESGRRGEHGVAVIRPTARSDPCAAERPGSPDRRGYASAAGTRGSWHDGGCWAGRCACPCSRCGLQASHYKQVSTVSWQPRGAGGVHDKGTRRKRETTSRVRTDDRPHQIGGTRPCRSAIRLPPGDTCPDELLWQAATLVSVPLLLWARGDLAGPMWLAERRNVEPVGGSMVTAVHSCTVVDNPVDTSTHGAPSMLLAVRHDVGSTQR